MNNTQEIIWDVPVEEVQIGTPVGWEAELSLNRYFEPVLYHLSTYEEIVASPVGTFFYSLDGGITWINYPIGEQGQIFYSAYKMKLVVASSIMGYVFAEKFGKVYRISSDGRTQIENYTVGAFDTTSFEVDAQNNLYLAGQNKTLYKVDTFTKLKAGYNSINIHSNPLGVLVDPARETFWQIDRDKIILKNLSSSVISSKELPMEIDVNDYSSSSSSGSTGILSSSSSSSTEILTSSSSSP